MNAEQAISKMIAPGTRRKGKYREGVIQIWVTRHCDKACFGCTQGSNLRHFASLNLNAEVLYPVQQFITPEQFEQAVISLKGYFGVVGVFGGNPCIHPQFDELCEILRAHIPREQRGLWSNNALGKGKICRATFDPSVSNINVHLDRRAFDEWKSDWPECFPVGVNKDSRHSPPYVAIKDVLTKVCPQCNGTRDQPEELASRCSPDDKWCRACDGTGKVFDESKAWELISDCDINKHWSAMIGVFRGNLRAWFCEIAGAQAMLHQHEADYPDTGLDPTKSYGMTTVTMPREQQWWELPMYWFADQVKKHCLDCGIPLRGYGQLAQSTDPLACEQVSATHEGIYRSKKIARPVQVVTDLQQLGIGKLEKVTAYLQNSEK